MKYRSEILHPGGHVFYEPLPNSDKYYEIYRTAEHGDFLRNIVSHFDLMSNIFGEPGK